jgi:3'(2'), 5'-bisphosphate nucleotidase
MADPLVLQAMRGYSSVVIDRHLSGAWPMHDDDFEDLAQSLIDTARNAGVVIMRHRASGAGARFKPDGSPVTAADQDAEALILADLAHLAPGIPVVAEESIDTLSASFDADKPFFLVDPLDGTKEFVRGGPEFTVNIALIRERQPVFGLIYAPATGRLFLTARRGEAISAQMEASSVAGRPDPSAFKTVRTRAPDPTRLTVLASQSHLNQKTADYIARFNIGETLRSSSSMKFCVIAEGAADLYPRLAPTSEWDTAAGHAILCAAGGCVLGEDGAPLTYGKAPEKFINSGFVAWGRQVPA